MINVVFDIRITDNEDENAWLDPYERDMMLEHTRSQINTHIQRALGELMCDTHHQPPQVTITGTYNNDTEELDVNYDIQTCCQLFLMQCVVTLNKR
jgi:hypothetical protein